MVFDGFNDTGLHVEIHVFFFHIIEGRLTPVVLVGCPLLCGVRRHCLVGISMIIPLLWRIFHGNAALNVCSYVKLWRVYGLSIWSIDLTL